MSTQLSKFGRWSLVPKDVKTQLLVSFYLTVLITLVSTIYYFLAQPELPFFYTLPLPQQALGSKIWLFFFPLFSFLITLLHMIVISFYQDLEALVLRLFANMTAVIQVILLLALIRVVIITI
jgi:hypothetical protein